MAPGAVPQGMNEEDVQAAAHAAAEEAAASSDVRRAAAGAMDAQSRYYALAHRCGRRQDGRRPEERGRHVGGRHRVLLRVRRGAEPHLCLLRAPPPPPACSNTEEVVDQPKLLRPPNNATLREYQIVGLQASAPTGAGRPARAAVPVQAGRGLPEACLQPCGLLAAFRMCAC